MYYWYQNAILGKSARDFETVGATEIYIYIQGSCFRLLKSAQRLAAGLDRDGRHN